MAEASGSPGAGKKARATRPASAKKAPAPAKTARGKAAAPALLADVEMTPAAAAHAEVIEALTAVSPKPAPVQNAESKAKPAPSPAAPEAHPIAATIPNFERLAQNVTRMMTEGSRVMAAYMKPLEAGENPNNPANEMVDAVRSLGKVAEYWLSDPFRAMQAQTALNTKFVEIWGNAFRRMTGEDLAAGLFAQRELGERHGRARRGTGYALPRQGRLLCAPDRQRAVALQLRRHQS